MHYNAHNNARYHYFSYKLLMLLFIFWLKTLVFECPRGEIGRHKGLKFNLSALGESLKVELVKFGEGLTANTEPRQHSCKV